MRKSINVNIQFNDYIIFRKEKQSKDILNVNIKLLLFDVVVVVIVIVCVGAASSFANENIIEAVVNETKELVRILCTRTVPTTEFSFKAHTY